MGAIKNRHMWLGLSIAIFFIFILSKLGYPIDLLGKHYNLTNPIIHLLSFFFAGGCFYLYRDEINFDSKIALIFSVLLFACLFNTALAELALLFLGGYLLIYFAFSAIPLLSRFQTAPDISYGIYLYGWPVQMLLIWYIGGITPIGVFFLAMAICFLLGLVSWYSIEKPFLKLKKLKSGWRHNIGQKTRSIQ
jgi:peptidoglycan/LPS O-acetylase OafA/YrhL